ncbi:MAG: hypothetical protein LBV20_04150 [Treponema sp.]|nr:hypothetical protein [Treponema sp.]
MNNFFLTLVCGKTSLTAKKLFCILFFCMSVFSLFAMGSSERDFLADTGKAAGTELTEDQEKVAEFVFDIYSGIYGYDEGLEAAKANEMTDEEYENTVSVAAKVAVNPIAKGLLSAGAFGEKTLKALIVTSEDALKAAGTWIDEQAQEYDSRNN